MLMTVSPTDYFRRLSQLMTSTLVTDGTGRGVTLDDAFQQSVNTIRSKANDGGKILIVANGGSAAIASHLQNDLSKACKIPAQVFTEAPLLTALANDDGYETAYETAVRLWAKSSDLLIAISSSGKSENILRSVEAARSAGSGVITLSGFGGENPLRSKGDMNYYVASSHYGLVETAHAAITHYLSDAVGNLLDIDRSPR